MKNRRVYLSRHAILSLILLVFLILIILRLFDIQIIDGQSYYEKISDVTVKNIEIHGERGIIFDCNGGKIAYNEKVYDVIMYYRRKTEEDLNSDLLELYDLLADNNEKINSDFPKYFSISPIGYGEKLKTEEDISLWLTEMVLRETDLDMLETPHDVFDYFRTKKFKISEEYSDEDAYKIMCIRYSMLMTKWNQLMPFLVSENISIETMAKIEIRKNDLQGLYTEEKYVRKYIDSDAFSSITGYIRTIEPEEVEWYFSKGYDLNELVGKDGLEKSYEKYLRSLSGIKTAILEPGEIELEFETSIDPVSGFDLLTSIDSNIQQVAYDSLGKNIEKIVSEKDNIINFGDAKNGSAVMINVNTGDIISLVSFPGYDANAFIRNVEEEIKRITEDENKLQLNRAIQGLYPAGSTFKPLTAIAALQTGAYTPGELITDDGVINYDGMDFYSMEYKKYGITYGDIDLKYALQVSANVFFYKIGVSTGINNLDIWAKRFGLGEKSGIDIGGEAKGRRNSRETMTQIESDRSWGRADTAQASIGQLYNQFTPLQLVRYIAAIANGGKLYTPRIVSGMNKRDGSQVITFAPEYIETSVTVSLLQEVQKGMLAVTNETDGAAVDIFKDFPYGQGAAKTGTPETGREAMGTSSHSIFVCYAPYDDPEVAVCVVIENGVWGANSASIAYDMLLEYFIGRE